MGNKALLVIDMQNCFVDGGELGIKGGHALGSDIKDFIDKHQKDYAAIISSQDWHIDPGHHFSDNPDYVDTWPRHGEANTFSAEIIDELKHITFDFQIKKGQHSPGYSAFEGASDKESKLDDYLKEHEIDTVDICGLALSHCVLQSALDAQRLGYKTCVFSNLSLAVDASKTDEILKQLQDAGVQIKRA